MSKRTTALLYLLLGAALATGAWVLVGAIDGEDGGETVAGEAPNPATPADERDGAERDRRERELQEETDVPPFRAENSFGEVADALPTGQPPLRVEQFLIDEGAQALVARVDREGFLCEKTVEERRAAVAAFYTDALTRFRAAGIEEFKLTVAPVTSSLEVEPFATAQDGTITLTSAGRASRRC